MAVRVLRMDHLQRVRGNWRVQVKVPAALRPIIGRESLTKGLNCQGTRSEARVLSLPYVAAFLTQIAEAKGQLIPMVWMPFERQVERVVRPRFGGGSETMTVERGGFGSRLLPKGSPAPQLNAKSGRLPFETLLDDWSLENTDPHARRFRSKVFRDFAAHLGHDDAKRVTPANIVSFKELLLRADKLAKKSVQNYITAIKGVLKFAADNQKITGNPGEGITYKAPDGEKMLGYTEDERAIILRAALDQPDHVKFPILIAGFSGCRIGEIADASTADIEEVDGIWCLQIRTLNREKGQTLKTAGSTRTVPLHSEVLRQGFVSRYLPSLPSGSLFPAYKLNQDGRRADPASHHIAKFIRRQCDMTDRRKDPSHSFRHYVVGWLRDQGVRLDVAEGITGHGSARRSELWNYGEYVAAMAAAIERLPNPLAR